MDERTAVEVFKIITLENPTYTVRGVYRDAVYAPDCRDKVLSCVRDAANNLTTDPTSVHDICGRFEHITSTNRRYASVTDECFMRKLFATAADLGIIKRTSIKTCGRTHINLYYI